MTTSLTITQFKHVEGRVYAVPEQTPFYHQVGPPWVPPHSALRIYFWPGETADVTIPRFAKLLVWLKIVDPHDVNWIAAAHVHDRFLKQGYGCVFSANELRRVLRHRLPKHKWRAEAAGILAAVYTHMNRRRS